MKKIAKGFLFLVCLGVIVFLLLPFLETENNTASGSALQTTAEPQIFTSNPLTTLVQRLASLFRKNNAKENPTPVQTTAALTKEEAEERFGVPQYKTRGAGDGDMSEQEVLSAAPGGTVTTSASGETMYLNEDGEWVLIRQISHETSTPGMHEINIKDNAYDAYVRQQQAAALNPALQTGQAAPKEDSYWQKLIRPVKKLFRTSDAKPVANKGLQTGSQDANAFMLASADGLTKNGTSRNGQFKPNQPNFNLSAADFDGQPTAQETKKAVEQMASLLSPQAAVEEVAKTVADMAVPEQNTPEQKQQHQEIEQKSLEQLWTKANEMIKSNLEMIQQNTPDEDVIQKITQNSCRAESLPSKEDDCSQHQPIPKDVQKETKLANAKKFTEITKIPVPHVPILPVAGVVTNPLQFEQMTTGSDPSLIPQDEVRVSREIMDLMAKVKGCEQGNTCFAIANEIQKDPSLKDSIQMAGGIFAGDKTNYQAFEQPFVQKRLLELPPDATNEQRKQAEEQAHKEFKEYAPAYVFVDGKELTAIQQKTDAILKGQASADTSFLYVMDGHDALTVSNTTGSNLFLFSRSSLQNDPITQSQVATENFAENIQQVQNITKQIAGEKGKEILSEQAVKAVKAYNHILRQSKGDKNSMAEQWNELTKEELKKLQKK